MSDKLQPNKKRSGFALITPFQQYPDQRTKFFAEHTGVKILEEIKTLSVGEIEVPDPVLIGRTKKQQTILIAWGIVFEESIK
jgi:hypothetical protein